MTSLPAARSLLWPLVPLYRAGLAVREFGLRTGLEKTRRLHWPVISIGNLSTGGSGKTPLTIALAKALAARGLHVDVLSRGYGRQRSARPLLVERDGAADSFGDEPLLIAQQTDVPVYVAAERYEAGMLAEKASEQVTEPASQRTGMHLLDDGFQHRQLARDVDILLLNSQDLADHLLPAGNLREPLHGAERASVIAIPADEPEVAAWIEAQGWGKAIWRLKRRMDVPEIDGRAAAFCGIARPQQFFASLERAGVKLAGRVAFRDHHRYTAADLDRISTEARKAGATTLLTTEKDRVRIGGLAAALPASLPLKVVPLRIEIQDETEAVDWLMQRVVRPYGA